MPAFGRISQMSANVAVDGARDPRQTTGSMVRAICSRTAIGAQSQADLATASSDGVITRNTQRLQLSLVKSALTDHISPTPVRRNAGSSSMGRKP